MAITASIDCFFCDATGLLSEGADCEMCGGHGVISALCETPDQPNDGDDHGA
jgi:RecJ-like exonuclease